MPTNRPLSFRQLLLKSATPGQPAMLGGKRVSQYLPPEHCACGWHRRRYNVLRGPVVKFGYPIPHECPLVPPAAMVAVEQPIYGPIYLSNGDVEWGEVRAGEVDNG